MQRKTSYCEPGDVSRASRRQARLALAGLALAAVLAGCGGGGPAGGSETMAARLDAPVSTCTFSHVFLTVTAVRVRPAAGPWRTLPLTQPRELDLREAGTQGLLQALGLPPLPSGDYTEVRLVLAAHDAAHRVHTPGGAWPLQVPSGDASGLKIKDRFHVPAGTGADLVLAGFDPCAIRQLGKANRFMLDATLDATLTPTQAAPVAGPEQALPTAAALQVHPAGGLVAIETDLEAGTWAVQRFSATGVPSGARVVLASADPHALRTGGIRLIALAAGGYAAIWPGPILRYERFGPPVYGLMVQTYTPEGARIGEPRLVGETTPFHHEVGPGALPTAAALGDGSFVAAWKSGFALLVRRFLPDGTPVTEEQLVASVGTIHLSATGLSTGGYMIGWRGFGSHASGSRAYTATDSPVGPVQPSGVPTGGSPGDPAPALAPLANGGAVGVWATVFGDGPHRVHDLPLAPDASPVRALSSVDGASPSDGDQRQPVAAGLADGGYVVAWIEDGEVHARRFSALGVALGPETRIDLTTTAAAHPVVLAQADGGFVIGWTATGTDGVRRDYLRAFSAAALLGVP